MAHGLLVAPWSVGSSRTRDQTRVSCISRRILFQRAAGEAPHWILVAACGIFLPDQESNPGGLHGERGVLATGPTRKSQ